MLPPGLIYCRVWKVLCLQHGCSVTAGCSKGEIPQHASKLNTSEPGCSEWFTRTRGTERLLTPQRSNSPTCAASASVSECQQSAGRRGERVTQFHCWPMTRTEGQRRNMRLKRFARRRSCPTGRGWWWTLLQREQLEMGKEQIEAAVERGTRGLMHRGAL